jgi:hypothetical protein
VDDLGTREKMIGLIKIRACLMHTFFKDHLKHAEHAPEIITCMLSNELSMRLIRFLMKIQISERQSKKNFQHQNSHAWVSLKERITKKTETKDP